MASPFSVFRKHQKFMIATLALLAMFGFIVLPILLKQIQGRPVENPVVVKTAEYGNITEQELRHMRLRRQRVLNFLQQAVLISDIEPMAARIRLQWLRTTLGTADEESTVDTWLLVRRADSLGMTLGTKLTNEFLKDLTQNKVTPKQFAGLYKRLGMSDREVFDSLHNELLARNMRTMFLTSLAGTTPAQRWDYYQRLNRRVTVEVAPVSVAAHVEKVPDPDEPTLKAFFEEHKTSYADPGSPEPGFRVPRKVAIEYFKAEYDQFADPASVTDKEVETYYSENRDRDFRKVELPGLPQEEPAAETSDEKPDKKPDNEKIPDNKPDNKKTPEKEPDKTEKPAAETPEKIQGKPNSGEKEGAKLPADVEPGTKTGKNNKQGKDDRQGKDHEPDKGDTGPEQPNGESAMRTASLFHLASLLAQEGKREDEPADERADERADKGADKRAPATAEPGQPAAEPAKAKDSEDKPAESDKAKDDKTAKEDDVRKTEAADKPPDEPEKVEYKPLEEVKEEIRRILAGQKAHERIMKKLNPLRDAMRKYRRDLFIYKARAEDSAEAAPARPDLARLAKQNNLGLFRTSLISELETYQLDIGKSFVDGQQAFVDRVFEPRNEFRPCLSQDVDRSYYLSWKTENVDDRIPEFNDEGIRDEGIRDEVLLAWKMVQARDLALKEAERLADKARKVGKKSLAESIGKEPRVKISEAGPFSWMTRGSMSAMMYRVPPKLSQMEHVEAAGGEFMRTVYDLTVGRIGVAMNQPKTIAYVVRLVDTEPDEKVLWQLFEVDDYGKYAAVALDDQRQLLKAWRDQLQLDAGLTWIRPADRAMPRSR